MVIKAIYPPYLYDCFEPRQAQTSSIFEILVPVTPISEKGTELPYHESYTFWTNPANRVTYEDIRQLRTHLFGEEGEYPIASEAVDEF